MASILNNSSFIFNPAGSIISYQEDKVYSVLPNDGSVDGVVGGNSGGGTRVNQQGYIEPTPYNMFTYSNDLSNGIYAFAIGGGSLGGIVQGPTPEIFGRTVNLNIGGYFYNIAINGPYYNTFSTIICSVWMRVTSGTLSLQIGNPYGAPYETKTLTTTWQRFSIIYDNTVPSLGLGIYNSITGVAISIEVAGFQANLGTVVKDYQPTTDRLNYPRITYQNGRGALLSEPQRTNVNTYSQDFTNAVWGKYSVTVTGSAAISPDGTMNAAKLVLTATSGELGTSAPVSDGYTTIFAKAGNVGRLSLYRGNTSFGTEFNLYNGTIISGTGTIEPYKDGWYRIGVKMDANRSINPYFAGGYAVGDYVYIWGAQSEEGNFATSYIPTTSATVTRAATDVVFNSPGPTKAFATKPGVILYDFDFYNFSDSAAGNSTFLYNGGTTGGDYFYFAKLAGTGQIYWDGDNSGGYFFAGQFTPKQGKNKVAWYFTNTNSYWYVNGSLLYTGTYFDTTYFNSMQTYAVPGNNFAVNTFASIPNTSSISQAQVQAWTNFNSGSGGNISYYGPYTIHTFTGSATFTPSFNGEVEVLVVAGGGSGAELFGGGGAGGLIYASSIGVAQGTGYTITIGAGGASQSTYQNNGNNGSNSSAFGLVTIGGGGGGAQSVGLNGGSGGGGGDWAGIGYGGGVGTTGQGNNGGQGEPTGYDGSGGGGGGAGQAGQTGAVLQAGKGGDGLPYSISGFSTYYAGGGGGTCWQGSGTGVGTNGLGGLGGGGLGGNGTTNINSIGGPAVDYTGGGGGAAVRNGGTAYASGKGGNGIVIVRYLT